MQNTEEIAELIKKKLDGIITTDEELQLARWLESSKVNEAFLTQILQGDVLWEDVLIWLELGNEDQETWQNRLERKVFAKISESTVDRRRVSILRRIIPYAAAILLFATVGSYYYYDRGEQLVKNSQIIHDMAPGGNKATLTLTGGHTIELMVDKNGIVIGEELTYDDGTLLDSAPSTNGENDETNQFFVLTIPKGGQYQVRLSDGTKVWLNAASKLKYPAKFSNEERVVELEGEAYFEVAQVRKKGNPKESTSQRIPFRVKTPNQEIEVLGTQFNVSAYANEPETKTTLVEGSVVLTSNSEVLKLLPGEQGVSMNAALTKTAVDVTAFIAWKDNKFIFNETELRAVMNQLSRWYDLQVIYEGIIPKVYFYGEISRDKSLSEVLKIIEEGGGVSFKIEKLSGENRLVVLP